VFGDPTYAEANLDPAYSRIYRIDLTRDSMRRRKLCTL
jgi:hypothetical protein